MIIRGAKVYRNHEFTQQDLYVEGERIVSAFEPDIAKPEGDPLQKECKAQDRIIDAGGLYAIPGLIDLHLHGVRNADLCDGTRDALDVMTAYEAQNGILAICPAVMTLAPRQVEEIVAMAADYPKAAAHADLVGIRLEGPFLSHEKCGAQNKDHLLAPNGKWLEKLLLKSRGRLRMVDLAPELEGAIKLIEDYRDRVVFSLAHSVCDYETARQAFDKGMTHVTHLYNAMPGISHRAPGPVIAAWEKGAMVELICDGIHVDPAMVRFTFQLFGKDRVILISDSMRGCGLEDGTYDLGGQQVTVTDKRAVLTEHPDTIAGSVTNLYQCMKIAHQQMGVKLEDVIQAATENPARVLGIQKDYGFLTPGHLANVLLVDEELQLRGILQRGVWRRMDF